MVDRTATIFVAAAFAGMPEAILRSRYRAAAAWSAFPPTLFAFSRNSPSPGRNTDGKDVNRDQAPRAKGQPKSRARHRPHPECEIQNQERGNRDEERYQRAIIRPPKFYSFAVRKKVVAKEAHRPTPQSARHAQRMVAYSWVSKPAVTPNSENAGRNVRMAASAAHKQPFRFPSVADARTARSIKETVHFSLSERVVSYSRAAISGLSA